MIHPINMPADFQHGRPQSGTTIDLLTPFTTIGTRKTSVSYTDDGRRIRNGQATSPRSPHSLWNDVLLRSFVRQVYQRDDKDDNGSDSKKIPIKNVVTVEVQESPTNGDGGVKQSSHKLVCRSVSANYVVQTDNEQQPAPPQLLAWADLCVDENELAHHTNRFEKCKSADTTSSQSLLVIRRGQPFFIELAFDERLRVDDNLLASLRLVIEFGKNPLTSIGTRMIVPLEHNASSAHCTLLDWHLIGAHRCRLRLQLSAQTSPIGVATVKIVDDGYAREYPIGSICLLFNPWCSDDEVYMPDATDRDEYILNDVGAVQLNRCWIYGQFVRGILDAAMHILDASAFPLVHHSSAVHVSRTIAAIMMSRAHGVVQGAWSVDFLSSTDEIDRLMPSQWTGSVDILRAYRQLGSQSIQYAYCPELAGTITTVLRALGIPARPVVARWTSHDLDTCCTLNIYFSQESGKLLNAPRNQHHRWIYHVWNECWMKRADLSPTDSVDGWQAIDATPQEKLDGAYYAGPCPVEAIRQGKTYLPFECALFFAEINAKLRCWTLNDRTSEAVEAKFIQNDRYQPRIMTKKCGSNDFVDITENYKHLLDPNPVHNLCKSVHPADNDSFMRPQFPDCISLLLEMDEMVKIGETVQVQLKIRNNSAIDKHNLHIYLRIYAVDYTGNVIGSKLAAKSCIIELKPLADKTMTIECAPSDYISRLSSTGHPITFMCTVVAKHLSKCCTFATTIGYSQLVLPTIQFETLSTESSIDHGGIIGQPMPIVVTVTNPLTSLALANCSMMIEGVNLLVATEMQCADICAGGVGRFQVTLMPTVCGQLTLIANFRSDRIAGFHGYQKIDIRCGKD